MTVAAKQVVKRKAAGYLSVVACCGTPPVLEMSKHELDPVSALVFFLVVSNGFAPGFPSRNAKLYFLRFQGISKLVGVVPLIGQYPLCDGRAIERG